MVMLGAIAGLALLWLLLEVSGLRRRGIGLLVLESRHSVDMASVWLRVANGYKLLVEDPAQGLFVWERGRRFHDGGFFYYGHISRDARSGRARLAVGVIGHPFHRAEELASARARFVGTQVFHLSEKSARNAVERAANPRTARRVHPSMRKFVGQQSQRPPVIDAPMSPSAVRVSMRAQMSDVTAVIAGLSRSGWRLVETAALSRGLVLQHRYCFADAPERKDAGAEYLLEVCGYADDWVYLAVDWFPLAGSSRTPRRPAELAADITRSVENLRVREAEAAE